MNLTFIGYQPNFQALKPIPKLAHQIGGEALQQALPQLEEIAKDVDIEIIPKKGFFSKIKNLSFFVTNPGKDIGRWFSLSVDPKGYMDHNKDNEHYKSVDTFTKENILESAKKAKSLNKKGLKVERDTIASMPADAAIVAKWLHERQKEGVTQADFERAATIADWLQEREQKKAADAQEQ